MSKFPTQTHESNPLLALGEKLRENPRTISLSVPVLVFGILLYNLIGNKHALAGAYGHLGLTFRLYYKHHWQNAVFLKIAYWLLSQSAKLGTGNGQPTVRMVMGSIAVEQGKYKEARMDFEKGLRAAQRIKDFPQAAFIESHLGRLEIQINDLILAQKHLDHSYKLLASFAKNKVEPRPHIWLSNVEIGMSELSFAMGDKNEARMWAGKVERRAEKYNLETRKLDAKNLLSRIGNAVKVFILAVVASR